MALPGPKNTKKTGQNADKSAPPTLVPPRQSHPASQGHDHQEALSALNTAKNEEVLELSKYPILEDKGRVGALEARLKAEHEYEVFRQRQDAEYVSDFDEESRRPDGDREDDPE